MSMLPRLARLVAVSATAFALAFARDARADHVFGEVDQQADVVPPELADVGVTEHPGAQLPLDVTLHDEQGKDVRIGDFVNGTKPVLLSFVYHSCPTLCSLVLDGFTTSMRDVPWTIGDQFEVLTISIDERDTPAIASEKKARMLEKYGRSKDVAAKGWHFLTGDPRSVKVLAEAVGFTYHWDARDNQFAHSAAIFVLTPTGLVSRYLYGIEFPPRDVHLAMLEASTGKVAPTAYEHLLLYCYRYDPAARGYVLVAMNVMRVASGVSVLLVGSLLAVLWRREVKRKKVALAAASSPSA